MGGWRVVRTGWTYVLTVGRLLLSVGGPSGLGPGGMGALAALGGSLLMCQSGGLTGLIGGGAKVNQAATA